MNRLAAAALGAAPWLASSIALVAVGALAAGAVTFGAGSIGAGVAHAEGLRALGDVCKASDECLSSLQCGSAGVCVPKARGVNWPLYPIAGWSASPDGHKQRLVSIFGSWERDDSSDLKQAVVVAPVVYHRHDRKRTVDVVPPFYFHWRAHDGSTSGGMAGPFVWSADPHGSTMAVPPFYFRFHDDRQNATSQLLFPIVGWHSHDGAAGGFVGPLFGWGSRNTGHWGAGIAPVLFFGHSGDRSHAMLLPLFAHSADRAAGTTTTGVGPVWVHTTRDGGDGGLFPLVFAGKHGRSSYALVPGVLFHKVNADGGLEVVGPVWAGWGKRWAAGLFPLFGAAGGQGGHSYQTVLPPLFIHVADKRNDSDRLLVGPFFHRRDGAEAADVLFPLFYLRRSPANAFGLWLTGGYVRHGAVATTVVFPFIHRRDDAARSSTTLVFPLVGVHDSPDYKVRVVFPLFWRIRDGETDATALFPLYFHGRSPTRSWDGLFPLFIHARTQTASTTVVGPLWVRTRPRGDIGGGLFPLFGFNKKVDQGKSSTWFGMPGLYVDRNTFSGTSHIWFLTFYRAHRPDGYSAGVVPFAFGWRNGTLSKGLAPFFFHASDPTRDYALDYFLLGYYTHEGKAHGWGILPFIYESTHKDGTYAGGAFPLVYYAKRTDGSTLVTPLGGWATSPGSTRYAVGPVYIRHDREVNGAGLLPFFYHQRNSATGGRLSMALPLYFDVRGGDGRELQAYSPLAWRYHTVTSSTVLGLPLFLDHHEYGESRTTVLLPFFAHAHNSVENTTQNSIIPLLTWWRKTPTETDAVVFPIVWRFGGENPTTVVAPIIWDFQRPSGRITLVFPIAARWHHEDAEHTLGPLVYYKKGVGPREGMWYLNIFPLMAVGRAQPKDLEWSVLEGLLSYRRQGRNRTLKFLWVFETKLKPLPAQNVASDAKPSSPKSHF